MQLEDSLCSGEVEEGFGGWRGQADEGKVTLVAGWDVSGKGQPQERSLGEVLTQLQKGE